MLMTKHRRVVNCFVLLIAMSSSYAVAPQTGPTHPYANKKALTEPTIFGEGIISTGEYDSHPAFTPDGRTLYFVRSTPTFSFWTIMVSRFDGDACAM